MTKVYKVHPSIGVARVGNSDEFFIGPELPGTFARPADGRYRDGGKKLRRQAARFWVFEHDDEHPEEAARPVFAHARQYDGKHSVAERVGSRFEKQVG